ncbi:hypothetical protein PMIN06_010834 [Paraphaeosphaeria minitans]|uniref:Uncharacterized protein n=1 Tax=Paraphaeosphaeria minitans TaxID=565426 RepID=A0A9P6GFH1_9PLEO|nr:hypothetical protein PMIN01_09068 [Paraphaeosphaeria minitans]
MPALAPSNSGAPNLDSLTTRDPTTQLAPDGAFASFEITTRSLESRQIVQGLIPTYYRQDGPGTGAVVGITLGSVAGFLLLVWLLWTLTNNSRNAISGEEEIVVRKRPRRNSNSHRSRRGTRSEVREYERSPRRSGGRSTVIVEERTRSRPRSVVVEETRRRVPGDDMVEVIEEESEYERRRARRGSGYR